MRATHVILRAEWQPLPPELGNAGERLQQALEAWRDTPYRSGGRLRGVEGDCVGSVFGSIDDVDGRPRAQNPTLPPDAAFHNKQKAYKAVATLRRLYSPAERLRWDAGRLLLQPGDFLVVGTSAGGPGHLMIVGARKNHIWHSVQGCGFTQTGWALGQGFERLFAAYRLKDRWRWKWASRNHPTVEDCIARFQQ